jgi:hypothetical protein
MHRLAVASVMVWAATFAGLVQAHDTAKNPTGTWKWTQMRGDQKVDVTLKLKVDGDKVSGTVSMPGRDNETREIAISDAKYKDAELTFAVTVEFNDQKRTTKYAGKVSGHTIKGKIERERDGKAQSTDWEAKLEPEKKK